MKKGTLLLVFALLIQGSTTWGVPGDKQTTKKQRRAARKALERAQDNAQAATVAADLAERDACFAMVFGPQERPTDFNSKEQEESVLSEIALRASEQDTAHAAVAPAMAAADAQPKAPHKSGWLSLFKTDASNAGAAATAEKNTAAAQLKREQEATAEGYLAAIQTPGFTEVTAAIPQQALDIKESAAKKLFAKVVAEIAERTKTPSFDETNSSFTTASSLRRSSSHQKGHSRIWKTASNPSNPMNLIKLLQTTKVPDDEVTAYQSYLNQAVGNIVLQLEISHARRKHAKIVTEKEAICRMNSNLAWTLQKLLNVAREQNLSVSKESEAMIFHWLAENDQAIAELEKAQQVEIAQFKGAQTQSDIADALRRPSFRELIAQCRTINKSAFKSGANQASNMAQVIAINAELIGALKDGTATLNDAALFIATLRDKKIHLDERAFTKLRKTIITIENNKDASAQKQAEAHAKYVETADEITEKIENVILSYFTADANDLDRAKTPFANYMRWYEGEGVEEEDWE